MPIAHHLKLGRSRLKYDKRTFLFGNYVARVPNAPNQVRWDAGITSWPEFLNAGPDGIGDCTIAGLDRLVEIWTKNSTGSEVQIADSATLAAYETVSGYVPGNPATDNGATMLDALNLFRNSGVGGHTLYAYAAVPPTNPRQMKQAIWLMGGVYVGLQLPLSAMSQTMPGGMWTMTGRGWQSRPGTWGGHAATICGFTPSFLYIVPWGGDVGLMRMTWQFMFRYADEAYACLSSQDWAENTLAPSGFNLATLQADLAKL